MLNPGKTEIIAPVEKSTPQKSLPKLGESWHEKKIMPIDDNKTKEKMKRYVAASAAKAYLVAWRLA